MKLGRILTIFVLSVVTVLFLAACGANQTAEVEMSGALAGDAEQAVSAEHEDDHTVDEHADAHAEDHADDHAADSTDEHMADHADDHMDSHSEEAEHGDMEGMDHSDGDDHMGGMDHMHAEVPEEYAGKTNPFAGDADAIAAGEQIFQTYCVACHGTEGKGDGPAAATLDPKPANLADSMMMSMTTDDYLFWRVNEGGAMEPFNSAMPAWKGALSEEQIWQVISYVRTLSESN